MERSFRHEVIYTNAGPIPVSDVAASLLANEQLVREAAQLLEYVLPGLTIEKVEVSFHSAQTNSPLKEILAGAIFISYQKDITKGIPSVIESLTGLDIPKDLEGLITAFVFVIAVYGIAKAYDLFGKRPATLAPYPKPSAAIEGNFNNVLMVGGDLVGVEPDAIRRALDATYRGPKARQLAKRALTFISPAKREDGAAVVGGAVSVDAQTVREAPAAWEVDAAEDDDAHDPITSQRVVIHATDLDSQKSGWAGHLPGVYEKRLKMHLYPTVKTSELFGRKEVTADVILVSRRGADGELTPSLFHLVKVHSN